MTITGRQLTQELSQGALLHQSLARRGASSLVFSLGALMRSGGQHTTACKERQQ